MGVRTIVFQEGVRCETLQAMDSFTLTRAPYRIDLTEKWSLPDFGLGDFCFCSHRNRTWKFLPARWRWWLIFRGKRVKLAVCSKGCWPTSVCRWRCFKDQSISTTQRSFRCGELVVEKSESRNESGQNKNPAKTTVFFVAIFLSFQEWPKEILVGFLWSPEMVKLSQSWGSKEVVFHQQLMPFVFEGIIYFDIFQQQLKVLGVSSWDQQI